MSIQQVFIVRHGETDYNLSGRWQGYLDIPLNAMGREQARQVGQALAGRGITAVYSSDLIRAHDTGKGIAQACQLAEVQVDARLREINCGIFQGLTRSEILATYPLEQTHWDNSDNYCVPNGESRNQAQERAYEFWQQLIASTTDECVAVVSHGGTIRWLLNRLFTPTLIAGHHFVNTSITTLTRNGTAWNLTRVGDVAHLDRSGRAAGQTL